jgi:putative hydrolase of the HAD superfamily
VTTTRPPLEAVLFDLDDTLHDDTQTYRRAARDVAEMVAAERGVDVERVRSAYVRQADEFWVNLTAAGLRTNLSGLRARMWEAALRESGIEDADLAARCGVAYNEARKKYLAPWPGAIALLATLRAKGMKLGMITNGFAETHREKIELLQVGPAFDEIFIADEVGMLKPDPRLFEHACRALEVRPEAAAMVGDRYYRDVTGARDAGLFTVYLQIRDERLPPDAPPADATVARIEDVAAVLPALRSRE